MKRLIPLILIFSLLAACAPSAEELATQTATAATATAAAWTLTPTFTNTPTLTFTLTPSNTATSTETLTPSITSSPTETLTPTFSFPTVTVNAQAHCRYGPSKAYLHAADLYPGDTGTVRGRFAYSQWLYVKFDKLKYYCWVAPTVIDVVGDISLIEKTTPRLPGPSVLYKPPSWVRAVRQGNEVTITWEKVGMTLDDDRGYFIEAWVCQNGGYIWWTVSFPDQYTTSYTVTDEKGCPAASKGKLYAVEKHGYIEPVTIPWPAP
jgi:hypothetical protein